MAALWTISLVRAGTGVDDGWRYTAPGSSEHGKKGPGVLTAGNPSQTGTERF